jgi:hypothetical protein
MLAGDGQTIAEIGRNDKLILRATRRSGRFGAMWRRRVSRPGAEAIRCSKELAAKEGIFVGITSGRTFAGAEDRKRGAQGANILRMPRDYGERYLSTPLFADVPADMTEDERSISRSTPSAQLSG